MTAIDKGFQIAPRAAAEVENRKWEIALDMPQQRLEVLADVVIARALPEALGGPVVMAQGTPGDPIEVPGVERLPGHGDPPGAFRLGALQVRLMARATAHPSAAECRSRDNAADPSGACRRWAACPRSRSDECAAGPSLPVRS